jgi:hypothetical protein
MIDFTKLSPHELKKWNEQLRSQIQYAKRGWLAEMLEVWQGAHQKVKDEMRSRGVIYTIKTNE